MDVLAVLPSLRPGGAERVLLTLAGMLADHGRTVRIVAVDGDGSLRPPPGVPLTVLGRRRVRSAAPALVREIRRARPRAVISSETHLNVALCMLRPLFPSVTRLVVRESRMLDARGGDGLVVERRALRDRAYRWADVVLASSMPMAEDLRRGGVTEVIELPNPVDIAALRTAAGTGTPRVPTTRGRRLVAVGRLVPVKGLSDLVRIIGGAGHAGDRLDVVGDGPERDVLIEFAVRIGVGDRVVFHGHVPEPAGLIAAADALVLPSHSEGMPNVVLEALALGTPVVATTDVGTLLPLATELGPAALRLVPRERLGEAVAAVVPDAAPRPRPSLLPARHDIAHVHRSLDAIIDATGAGPSSREGRRRHGGPPPP